MCCSWDAGTTRWSRWSCRRWNIPTCHLVTLREASTIPAIRRQAASRPALSTAIACSPWRSCSACVASMEMRQSRPLSYDGLGPRALGAQPLPSVRAPLTGRWAERCGKLQGQFGLFSFPSPRLATMHGQAHHDELFGMPYNKSVLAQNSDQVSKCT